MIFFLKVWESSRSRASSSAAVLFEWQPGDADDIFLEAEKLARDAGRVSRARGAQMSFFLKDLNQFETLLVVLW